MEQGVSPAHYSSMPQPLRPQQVWWPAPRCRRGSAQAVSSSPQSGPSELITYTSARSSKIMIGAA
jgi:hypothetical protein